MSESFLVTSAWRKTHESLVEIGDFTPDQFEYVLTYFLGDKHNQKRCKFWSLKSLNHGPNMPKSGFVLDIFSNKRTYNLVVETIGSLWLKLSIKYGVKTC